MTKIAHFQARFDKNLLFEGYILYLGEIQYKKETVMKSDMNRIRRKGWMAAALCAMLVLLCSAGASAFPTKGIDDGDAKVNLTVSANNPSDGKAISGLKLTLYKVADMDVATNGQVTFTLTKEFEEYDDEGPKKIDGGLDPNDFDSSNWANAAQNLEPQVISDAAGGKTFTGDSKVTDAEGKASFTGLEQGLYLMSGSYTGTEFQSVEVTPALLTLPQWSNESGDWLLDATAMAKPKVTPKSETPKKTSVTAQKVWANDDTATADRPVSVIVELLDAEGKTVDRKTLSASTGWKATWTGLDEGKWSVKESIVPTGYAVSYVEETTAEGKTITVKNTKNGGGVLGASREKTDTTTKGSARQGDTGSVAGAERLPQTGQLWWPVWVLAGLAAVLVIIGLILRMSGRKDLRDR